MRFLYLLLVMISVQAAPSFGQQAILTTSQDVKAVRESLGKYPLLNKSYAELEQLAAEALKRPMDVPVPKDPAGGYTHEQHKRNYQAMHAAGIIYAIGKDQRYADFVKNMLLVYSELIPSLGNHPQAKGSSPGRLFHQALNDCNWIAYSIQGYDAIAAGLTAGERKKIEEGVFRPMSSFLTKDLESWFNLVHNHGVWAVSAVGMTGFVLRDQHLVQQALLGTKMDGKGGFLSQLDNLFSPDGFYTEGPYYVRYALLPFFLFAQAIEQNMPERKIFEYRNQILKKAFYAALQQTDSKGKFLPINDALKEKGWDTREMVTALAIVFQRYGEDASLLEIARQQERVLLTVGGTKIAKMDLMMKGKSPRFVRKSILFTDGAQGQDGGMALLRAEQGQMSLLFKYTGHGLSHGHFDKLMLALYDGGNEILSDYGAARFLNVEPKAGGRYLPENHSFAMQTIAHNTVTVDEQSHFQGKEKVAEKESGKLFFSDISHPDQQIVSARSTTAYPNVGLQRTLILLKDSSLTYPIILDIFRVSSEKQHQYDLPFYYSGHLINTNFPYEAETTLQKALGNQNGYEHLWKQAYATPKISPARLTWLNGEKFYSVTTAVDSTTQLIMMRVGANDPKFNLRPETAFMVRQNWAQGGTFASVIEPHGAFDPKAEIANGAESEVADIKIRYDQPDATIVDVQFRNGRAFRIALSNIDANPSMTHSVTLDGQIFSWKGPYSSRFL
ncbi:alginate lyase family protein [Dyadobacter tibetensis]|uniref:alginate lyase family protein n=1 Tax=Dyadobacter tibetensis TaxID=1211851 RepID=UPI0004AE35E7|nr:alginate lyase family protein [Dyadobacter tibetensis]